MQNFARVAVIQQKKSQRQSVVQSVPAKIYLNLYFVTNVVRNFNLLIEHQCPQCGAPVDLKETDRLFICRYCRVNSCLLPSDYFRYLFPKHGSAKKNLIFFPYWRFKGMMFSCLPSGIEHRFIDLSYQAVDSDFFPTSVGLRSQALKLQFVSPESEGRFLKPILPLRKAIGIYEKHFNIAMSNPTFHKVFIGETISLIYSPFYVKNKLYDGILDKPITSILPSNFETSLSAEKRPGRHVRFIPALCPDCGWDLSARAESIVLNCMNCNSMWRLTGNGLKKLKFGYIPEKGNNKIYLPFWRINAEITGIKLQTYSDLVKVANLPKAIQKGWNDIEFNFWTLAFKVRPQNFIRIAQQITLNQPQEISFSKIYHADHYPVTLSMEEAAQSLKVSLAGFMKPKDFILSELQNIKIRPKKILLVYIAFQENHHELIHNEFHVSINKNMLSLAGNL